MYNVFFACKPHMERTSWSKCKRPEGKTLLKPKNLEALLSTPVCFMQGAWEDCIIQSELLSKEPSKRWGAEETIFSLCLEVALIVFCDLLLDLKPRWPSSGLRQFGKIIVCLWIFEHAQCQNNVVTRTNLVPHCQDSIFSLRQTVEQKL